MHRPGGNGCGSVYKPLVGTTQAGKVPEPKPPVASWGQWKLTNFRQKTHTTHDILLLCLGLSDAPLQPVGSFQNTSQGTDQIPTFPGCGLLSSQSGATKSPERISKWLNSLCLYLYPNDGTLRCKLKRNLVSKSCHFLMDTSIKAHWEAPHCCQTLRKYFTGPPASPSTKRVGNSISPKYL